jgi:ATP-dependent Lon protease
MDDFDYSQFPDFPELFPELSGDLFDQPMTKDRNGLIECPFLPLRDVVLFPQMVMPLFIGRERSLAAIKAAIANDENLVVAAQRDSDDRSRCQRRLQPGHRNHHRQALRMPDNSTSVLAQGRRRVEILEFTQWDPYIRVRAKVIYEPLEWDRNTEALMRAVLTLFEKTVMLNRNMPEDAYTFAINIDEPGWLADFVASTLNIPIEMRQDVLETFDPGERLQKVSLLLAKELDVLELEDQIHSRVQQEMDRSQREHFLREQMRVIQGELGEGDVFSQEITEVREMAAAKPLPDTCGPRWTKKSLD